MANGVVGTLCALWLYNNFVGWLTFLSLAIPPIGGVIITDFIINRKRYQSFATTEFKVINWAGIIAVAIGVAAGHFLPGVVPINAVFGGALSYLALNALLNKEAQTEKSMA
jgi:cytosine permease